MAGGGYMSMKLKRRYIDDIDDVNDDFSDFSLSYPARKIRRLDADLPPIMEEEEPEMSLFQNQSAVPPATANQERAIVLFKQVNTNIPSPSNLTVSVDSDIISGFKNTNPFLWNSKFGHIKLAEDEETKQNKNNECLAVVPYVPSQLPPTPGMQVPQTEALELMEADELEEATMDIEDSNDASVGQGHTNVVGGMRAAEGLHQWQQQHCMIPQLPHNASTPITWFR